VTTLKNNTKRKGKTGVVVRGNHLEEEFDGYHLQAGNNDLEARNNHPEARSIIQKREVSFRGEK
jgi:hypothetical protein